MHARGFSIPNAYIIQSLFYRFSSSYGIALLYLWWRVGLAGFSSLLVLFQNKEQNKLKHPLDSLAIYWKYYLWVYRYGRWIYSGNGFTIHCGNLAKRFQTRKRLFQKRSRFTSISRLNDIRLWIFFRGWKRLGGSQNADPPRFL